MDRSTKIMPLCYICGNIGVVIWSVVLLLEGASLQRSAIVFIGSLLGMNLLLWLLFRAKANGNIS